MSGGPVAEATALTAALLGIPAEGRYAGSALGPQGRKVRLQEIWLQQLVGLAARRPVLMLLEDAHWIDPSSIEQFDLVVDAHPAAAGAAGGHVPARVRAPVVRTTRT